MTSNQTIAETAIALLQTGIEFGNKERILTAYDLIDDDKFSWDNLDTLYSTFEDLVEKGNEIIYS